MVVNKQSTLITRSAERVTFDFSPDTPIRSAEEDRLNRNRFAVALANAIANWRHSSSFVVALYGDWGSGKTSIKNMLIKSLDSHTVVEFNPWQISNEDRLTEVFFNDIGACLARPETDTIEDNQKASRRAAKWKLYGKLFGITSMVAKFAGTAVSAYLKRPDLQTVTTALDIAATAGEQAVKVAEQGAEALNASGTAFTPTLAELRREVAELLDELKQPLLVVLDDLDRLGQPEIRLMLQVVKANADFPNIIYLLLAKRESLEKALDGIAAEKGAEYLEKIVQASFSVPQASRAQMERVLFDGLNDLISREAINKRWNEAHWAKVYLEGIRPFFKNLRDIKRFLSSVSFHFSLFSSDNSFEVNPIDLIGLEVLRVFVPALYDVLPELKHVVTDQPRFLRKEKADRDREVLNRALHQVPESQKQAVRNIIETLFPPAATLLAGSHFNGDTDWASDLRICSYEVFDKYFQLGVPEGDVPQADIDHIFTLVGNHPGLSEKFSELDRRGLLEITLDRLDSVKHKIPLEKGYTFLSALFDLNISNDKDVIDSLQFTPQVHVARIVYGYLRREQNEECRFQLLMTSLAKTTGLNMPVHAVHNLTRDAAPNKPGDPDAFFQDPVRNELLRAKAVEMIRGARRSGRIADEKDLAYLMSVETWWNEDTRELRVWVSDFASTKTGLMRFLEATRQKSSFQSGYKRKDSYYFNLETIDKLISGEEISREIEKHDPESLSQEERMLVALYREAEQRRSEGKPERTLKSFDDA